MAALVKGFVVTLAGDLNAESAGELAQAIRHLKGVVSVEPVPAYPFEDEMVARRTRLALFEEVRDVFFPEFAAKGKG